jgi:hypothetical protein
MLIQSWDTFENVYTVAGDIRTTVDGMIELFTVDVVASRTTARTALQD